MVVKKAIPLLFPLLFWKGSFVGLSDQAWHLFLIFSSVIVGFVTKPLPMGPVAILGVVIAIATQTLPINDCFSGFSMGLVWLIVFVFFIARGIIKTRLGERIAYTFIKMLGKNALGLGYGITLVEVLLGPIIPSNTVRSGGIILPIVTSIASGLGSHPETEESAKRLGRFLVMIAYHGNIISSVLFLTAMVCNPLIQGMAAKHGINLSFTVWLKNAWIPGIISFFLVPLMLYLIYPPSQKKIPEAVDFASKKLKDMGAMHTNEQIMTGVLCVMMGLFCFGDNFGIPPLVVAMGSCLVILISKILTWDDMLHEKEAWNILVWLSFLLAFSAGLEKLGFINFLSDQMKSILPKDNWGVAFFALNFCYFYIHYFFASTTSHVSALYPAFLMVGLSAGIPPMLCAFSLASSTSLFACLTPYASIPAAVLFASGYVPAKDWWTLGFLFSIVYFVIFQGIGFFIW